MSTCVPLSDLSPNEIEALLHTLAGAQAEPFGFAREGVIRHVNAALLRLFGYSRAEELLGAPWTTVLAPDARALETSAGLEQGAPGVKRLRGLRRDGEVFDMEVRSVETQVEGERCVLRWVREVSEQVAAERACARHRAFYHALFDVNRAIKLVIDPEDGQIVDANRGAADFYGWPVERLRQMRIQEINASPDELVRRELALARDAQRVYFHFSHRIASGELRRVEIHTGPVVLGERTLLLSIIHDITERERLEEALRRACKLEAVGRLAASVAHDLNNLITVILGYGELLTPTLVDAGCREQLATMMQAAERAQALGQHLLAVGSQQALRPRVIALRDVVHGAVGMLRATLGSEVALGLELDAQVPDVIADPDQLEQVLINLASNARDAMPDGGVMTLALGRCVLEAPRAELAAGEYAVLRARDTGVGMSERTRARLFEPFFSTKPAGAGTGLGLATVYGTIKQSGGHISVESQPGAGTVFTIWLPAISEA